MTTATDIKIGLSIAKKLFGPKGGNPQLAISQANLELLRELHFRLDMIEEGVAEILTRVIRLPREMYEQSLEAQAYGLGRRILAIGENFMTDRARLLEMEQDTDLDPATFQREEARFRDDLNDWLYDLRLATYDLNTRKGALSVGALTNVAGVYIELGIRIEQTIRFGRSKRPLEKTAQQALDTFALILDAESQRGTLGDALAQTVVDWQSAANTGLWATPIDVSALDSNELRIVSKVFGPQGSYVEQPLQGHNDYDNPRNENYVWITHERPIVMRLTSTEDENGLWTFSVSAEDVDAPVAEYLRPNSINPGIRMNQVRGSRTFREMRDTYNSWLPQFQKLAHLAGDLSTMRDTVEQAVQGVERVLKGDYSTIFVDGIFTVDGLTIDDLNARLLAAEDAEALADVAAYQERLAANRARVSRLIQSQDAKIRAEFEAATKAARTNRLIGLIEMGLALYQMYERSEVRARDKKMISEKMKDTAERMEAVPDRSPASAAVVKALNRGANELAWWGGLLNAKRQAEALNAAARSIAITLPEGEVRQYLVIANGDRFHLLVPADGPQMFQDGPLIRSITTIQITGTKQD